MYSIYIYMCGTHFQSSIFWSGHLYRMLWQRRFFLSLVVVVFSHFSFDSKKFLILEFHVIHHISFKEFSQYFRFAEDVWYVWAIDMTTLQSQLFHSKINKYIYKLNWVAAQISFWRAHSKHSLLFMTNHSFAWFTHAWWVTIYHDKLLLNEIKEIWMKCEWEWNQHHR